MKKRPARPRAQVIKAREPLTMSLPFLAVDAASDNRLLANAIGWSVLLHMVVLAIHFSPFDVPRFDRNGPPLEVALVNAKSESKPTKADILAQARLDGGGNTDADRRAKTPLPVPLKDSATQDLSVATQQVSELEARTREMLTQLKSMDAMVPPTPKPNDAPEVPTLPNANEMMQRTLESMRLEAQIAKQMEAYQKRPKRRFVGARAEEYRFRALRRRLADEDRGGRQPQLPCRGARKEALRQPVDHRGHSRERDAGKHHDRSPFRTKDSRPRCEENRGDGGAIRAISRGHPPRHRHPLHHAHVDVCARRFTYQRMSDAGAAETRGPTRRD